MRKGTRLRCNGFPDQTIEVQRVAKDGSWVDVFVYDRLPETWWTKRMPLPLGETWTVIE